MGIVIKTGSSRDIRTIMDFLRQKTSFPLYIGFESPDIVRKVVARNIRANKKAFDNSDEHPLLMAYRKETDEPLGYLMLILGLEESITDEVESLILDYHVKECPDRGMIINMLLEEAERLSSQARCKYITHDLVLQLREEEQHFQNRGYRVDLNRIVKRIGTYTFDGPYQKQIKVRPARPNDLFFILNLNAENSSFLIPANRQVDCERIKKSFFETYADVDFAGDPFFRVLISEDIEKKKPAGYIMIKLDVVDLVSVKPIAYIYDISVVQKYWGKFVGQRLVKEAENMLSTLDIEYLVGDTAQSNPRPLKTAIRTLNFTHYSRRWIKETP